MTDSRLLQAARHIYTLYRDAWPTAQLPQGVVIHRESLRGDVVYGTQPVLLPQERFFPLQSLDSLTA